MRSSSHYRGGGQVRSCRIGQASPWARIANGFHDLRQFVHGGFLALLVLLLSGVGIPSAEAQWQAGRIAAGDLHTVGVRMSGSAIAAGWNGFGQCEVSNWIGVVSVAAGWGHTVGLRNYGTVVAVGDNYFGACNVSTWSGLTAIAAGGRQTIGLKADGRVIAACTGDASGCPLPGWTNVVAIATSGAHTLGVKTDATVLAMGDDSYGQCHVQDWRDIVAVAAGGSHTVGLKANGTAVAVGSGNFGQCYVAGWSNLVAVAAGTFHSVGLMANGRVVAIGLNAERQCEVSGWSNIVAIASGFGHTVGLRADGAVLSTTVMQPINNYGQSAVESWYLGPGDVPPIIVESPLREVAVLGGVTDLRVRAAGPSVLTYRWHKQGIPLNDGGRLSGVTTALLSNANVQLLDAGDYTVVVENAYGAVTSAVVNVEVRPMPGHPLPQVAAGSFLTAGLKVDGTVLATGFNYYGEREVGGWASMVKITAGYGHMVGLKADGTVLAVGWNGSGACNVGDWRNIVAVQAGPNHTVGLRADGSAVVASTDVRLAHVSGWSNLVAVAAGHFHTLGLTEQGSVLIVGSCGTGVNDFGQCDVSGWSNMVALAAGYSHTIGLRADGIVMTAGTSYYGDHDVSGWRNIVAIAAGESHSVGLRADGTVVATGFNQDGQCEVSDWTDIVAVAAGESHSVGLKRNGTVLTTGSETDPTANTFEWYLKTELIAPVITKEPLNQEVVLGQSAHFTAIAAGPGPLTYRWQKDGTDLGDGGRISGAGSTNLMIIVVETTDAGTYRLVAANAYGSTTSAVAVLNAALPPAISVQPGATELWSFNAPPPAYAWSTASVAGGASTFVDAFGLDSVVQQLAANGITNDLGTTLTMPPSTAALARWNGNGRFLQTRCAGVAASLLMARFRNDSGTTLHFLPLAYEQGIFSPTGNFEELPGYRVFYSLTGTPGNWVFIPQLSGLSNGLLNMYLELGGWLPGSMLYLLWVDDNGPSTDVGYVIDNLVASPHPVVAVGGVSAGQRYVEGTPIPLEATSVVGRPVTNVVFLVDSNPVANDSDWPFSVTYSNAALGPHTVWVLATDDLGGSHSSAVVAFEVVANQPPIVSFLGPTNESVLVGEMLSYTAQALDADGNIVRWDFFFDGQLILTRSYPYPEYANYDVKFGLGDLLAGSHCFAAIATDNLEARTTNALFFTVTNPPTVALLVTNGSNWKYLDNGTDQGTAWRERMFDDSGWSNGWAELGYGDSTHPERTIISYGPQATNKYITTYFRHAFTVADPSDYTNLVVRLLRDDSGVVYLNGVEVFRSNFGSFPVLYRTPADGFTSDNGTRYYETNAAPSVLVPGTNVVAVEVHLAYAGLENEDLSFDLMLWGKFEVPSLTIRRLAGDRAEMTWPVTNKHYVLEWNSRAAVTGWDIVTEPTIPAGGMHRVQVITGNATRFFRLRKQ